MFTFITCSFNQEKYIIQHLESIKYQILMFGKGKNIRYVLADDNSTDQTVALAERWLQFNSTLFQEIKILKSEENKGIVNNHLNGLSTIVNGEYKSLAGDDLFYKNDIFSALDGYDLVFSPTIVFEDNHNLVKTAMGFYEIGSRIKRKYAFVKRDLKFQNCISAPGAFIASRLIKDEELLSFLKQFKWIEDYPSWYYWFYKSGHSLSIDIVRKPYVLYRYSSGISKSEKTELHKVFLEERQRIVDEFKIKSGRIRYFSPFKYWRYLCNFFCSNILRDKNRESYKNISKDEIISYLSEIEVAANDFIKSILEE